MKSDRLFVVNTVDDGLSSLIRVDASVSYAIFWCFVCVFVGFIVVVILDDGELIILSYNNNAQQSSFKIQKNILSHSKHVFIPHQCGRLNNIG
jgi:hypothetical protein